MPDKYQKIIALRQIISNPSWAADLPCNHEIVM